MSYGHSSSCMSHLGAVGFPDGVGFDMEEIMALFCLSSFLHQAYILVFHTVVFDWVQFSLLYM